MFLGSINLWGASNRDYVPDPFLATIPAFNSDWRLPDQAYIGFSWNDGAIHLPSTPLPTPLRNAYIGATVAGQPDLHVFSFGDVVLNQSFTRVLEYEAISKIPDGETSLLASGTDSSLSITSANGEQRLLPNAGGHIVLPDGFNSFRVNNSQHMAGGFAYDSMAGSATRETVVAPITDDSIEAGFIAFNVGNPYAMLVEGAQWAWSYRNGAPYVFDWDTDWLYQSHLEPRLRDLPAPPNPDIVTAPASAVAQLIDIAPEYTSISDGRPEFPIGNLASAFDADQNTSADAWNASWQSVAAMYNWRPVKKIILTIVDGQNINTELRAGTDLVITANGIGSFEWDAPDGFILTSVAVFDASGSRTRFHVQVLALPSTTNTATTDIGSTND